MITSRSQKSFRKKKNIGRPVNHIIFLKFFKNIFLYIFFLSTSHKFDKADNNNNNKNMLHQNPVSTSNRAYHCHWPWWIQTKFLVSQNVAIIILSWLVLTGQIGIKHMQSISNDFETLLISTVSDLYNTNRETRLYFSDQRVYVTIFRNFLVSIYKMSQLCFTASDQDPAKSSYYLEEYA